MAKDTYQRITPGNREKIQCLKEFRCFALLFGRAVRLPRGLVGDHPFLRRFRVADAVGAFRNPRAILDHPGHIDWRARRGGLLGCTGHNERGDRQKV